MKFRIRKMIALLFENFIVPIVLSSLHKADSIIINDRADNAMYLQFSKRISFASKLDSK